MTELIEAAHTVRSTLGGSPFPPITDYGFLSDCEVSALVAPSGNVEWLCLPRMDGPSVFVAMLDRGAGWFRLGPGDEPQFRLTTDLNVGFEGPRAIARRRSQAGERVFCALSWQDGTPPQTFDEAHQRLARTADFWHEWLGRGMFCQHYGTTAPIAESALDPDGR
jgi:GH15 family glucan-1,4-alpha-glucosidase